jgi:hypothetical protein
MTFAVVCLWMSWVLGMGVQVPSGFKARRAVLAGGLVLALAAVAAVAMVGGEAVKTGEIRMELSDRNEFESEPAWYSSYHTFFLSRLLFLLLLLFCSCCSCQRLLLCRTTPKLAALLSVVPAYLWGQCDRQIGRAVAYVDIFRGCVRAMCFVFMCTGTRTGT